MFYLIKTYAQSKALAHNPESEHEIARLRTGVGGVLVGGGVGLLDSEASSEWTCLRIVSAANSADVSG